MYCALQFSRIHPAVSEVASLSISANLLGACAALITSTCWLPQMVKIFRERGAQGVSLSTNLALALGVLLWLFYGVSIGAWPVIASNAVTLAFVLAIVGMKLRYG